MSIRFDGRVAVITGAGAGLGREHALLLASRGAKVVVNDLGTNMSGDGGNKSAADSVVAEIRAAGGVAVANYDSVSDPQGAKRIVQTAVDEFGKIDILINNAGILRDKSFIKMELADFQAVLAVHLMGTVYCTHAAWPLMNAQKYGRIIVTTSIAGTNGNFGQTAYAAAKMGVLGFMNSLSIEGMKNGVLVNAVSPSAHTRMTEAMNPESFLRLLHPYLVSNVTAYLASEACTATGQIIAAGAGAYSRVHFFETEGKQFDPLSDISPEMVAQAYPEFTDLSTATPTTPGISGRMQQRLTSIGRWPG